MLEHIVDMPKYTVPDCTFCASREFGATKPSSRFGAKTPCCALPLASHLAYLEFVHSYGRPHGARSQAQTLLAQMLFQGYKSRLLYKPY